MCPIGYHQPRAGSTTCGSSNSTVLHRIEQEARGSQRSGAHTNTSHVQTQQCSSDGPERRSPSQELGSDLLYIGVAVMSLVMLASHRKWPLCVRVVDAFAQSHVVDDTHALRMLDTRIGVAFTVILALIGVALALSQWQFEPNRHTTSALIPASELQCQGNIESFGQITVVIAAIPSVPQTPCPSNTLRTSSPDMLSCDDAVWRSDGSYCELTTRCVVTAKVDGVPRISVELSAAFQTFVWTVSYDSFMSRVAETRILQKTMQPGKGASLAGTHDAPSILRTNLLKSVQIDNTRGGEIMAWSELFMSGVVLPTKRGVSSHVVALDFEVSSTAFRRVSSRILDLTSQISIVLSLVMSIMGVLRIVKKYVEYVLDLVLLRMCPLSRVRDVVQRRQILDEKHPIGDRSSVSPPGKSVELAASTGVERGESVMNPVTLYGSQVHGPRESSRLEDAIDRLRNDYTRQIKELRQQNRQIREQMQQQQQASKLLRAEIRRVRALIS